MFSELRSFFSRSDHLPRGFDESAEGEEFRYAAAALLVICAKSDFDEHPEERRAIVKALDISFGIHPDSIGEMLELAEEESGTRRLQEFTAIVNRLFTAEDKLLLLENLWRIAYADGRLDRFEEQYISRVAFLIKVIPDRVQACRERVAPV